MDNRQHGLKNAEISSQSKFSKWIRRFFGVKEKPEIIRVVRPLSFKHAKHGGSFGKAHYLTFGVRRGRV